MPNKPLLMLFISLTTFPSLGQWTSDPSVNTRVCTDTNLQTAPAISDDGAGGAIISWADARYDGSIFAQRLNSSGVPQWTAAGVAIDTNTFPGAGPSMVSDGEGGAVLVYSERDFAIPLLETTDVYAQRISSSGQPLWPPTGVPICVMSNGQSGYQIVSDGAGGAIMSWLDGRQSTQSCIYVQRISSGGSPQWTPNGVQVHETPAGGLGYQIVGDGSGGVVVIWGDIRNGLSAGATLYAQRINGGGVPMWQANGVHVNDSYAVRPAAASDGTGGAIIAWQNIFRRVLTQRINGSGQVLWDANGVQIGRATRNTDLILGTEDGNGGAIFAWSDDWAFPGSVYVQRVDSSGALQWATNGIQISAGPNQQEVYSMLKDGAGGAILAWHDYPNSVGSDYDIFVQHVNASGVVQWKTNGLPIATATNRQWLPVISLGQSGDSIYAWEDYRDGGSAPKIYAQRVTKTGGTASQPQIISARILAEGFQLNWTAEPSVNYVIEARESVITGNWQQVVASLTSTGSVATATISQQGFASRFFRIKKE